MPLQSGGDGEMRRVLRRIELERHAGIDARGHAMAGAEVAADAAAALAVNVARCNAVWRASASIQVAMAPLTAKGSPKIML